MTPHIRTVGLCLSLIATALLSGCLEGGRSTAAGPESPGEGGPDTSTASAIRVLSNWPHLISGGDALVEVDIPTGVDAASVKVTAGNQDVSHAFALRPNGRFMGLVEGLAEGDTTIRASLPDGSTPSLTLTNHPIGGPIFSGPQIQPWPCLEGALDEQCNRPVRYEFQYMPLTGFGLQPYDPANPPSDVAMTTTDQGHTVPFIIRIEHGTQNRGQYAIAVLFDPSQEWQPWAPQQGWNGKTVNHGGAGCGTHHGEGPVSNEYLDRGLEALSLGFLSWETQLSHNTQNCNLVVQAESLMMAKERIVEAYGPIRYTIGMGGSGGSIKQQQAANAYPGIFDGIVPAQSFTDTWATGAGEVLDCRYLIDYFLNPLRWAPGVLWLENQQAAVMGHPTTSICQSWINVFSFDQVLNPRPQTQNSNPLESFPDIQSCNVPADQGYDPQTNPEGVRCGLADYMVNVLGRRAEDGFAKRPVDNIGVQYGLGTLLDGSISTAQFLDLNAKVGSRNVDYDPVPERAEADPGAIAIAYRGGLFNQGDNMHLPILDLRGNDNVEIHHNWHSYEMRARLERSNGHADNHVIWFTATPGPETLLDIAFAAMDEWLTAIESDTSSTPYAQKVVLNKPESMTDGCWDGVMLRLPSESCALLNPYFFEPRIVAGEPLASDIGKCALKQPEPSDYAPIEWSDEEWAQLQAIFPQGVCDYSQPDIDRVPTQTWLGYSAGPGGRPLPNRGRPTGWSSGTLRSGIRE